MHENGGIGGAVRQEAGGIAPPARQGTLGLGLPAAEAAPTGKPGRPKGALNRRTEEFMAELAEMGAEPHLALARIIQRGGDMGDGLKAFAAELGCKPTELLDRVLRAAEILMPYVAPKLAAVAVNVSGKGGLAFAILDPKGLLGDGAAEGAPIVINQGVSDDDRA